MRGGTHRPSIQERGRQIVLKIEGVCREVIDKAERIAIATSGAEGAHLAGTWGKYIRALGVKNDDILLMPVGGYRTTERNLVSDNGIELLGATKQVQGAHGPGKDAESEEPAKCRPPETASRQRKKIFLGQRSAGCKSRGSQCTALALGQKGGAVLIAVSHPVLYSGRHAGLPFLTVPLPCTAEPLRD
jgi:hypothetical protein